MATLFDSASLALVPSGTKEGKLYSLKPTDGSGDFTFTRTLPALRKTSDSTAAVVSSDTPILQKNTGECPFCLMEPSAVQRVRYTNDFTQWTTGATVTANHATDPEGNVTSADRVQSGASQRTMTGEGCKTEQGKTYLVSFWAQSNVGADTVSIYTNGETSEKTLFSVDSDWAFYYHKFTAITDREVGFLFDPGVDVNLYEFNLIDVDYVLNSIKNDGTTATVTKPKDDASALSLSTLDTDLSTFTLAYKFKDLGEDFANDEDFTLPVAFGYTPPFSIKKSRFSGKHYASNFNLRTHAGVTATQTLYVDKAATGANNGTSWADAFTVISDAISAVNQPTTILIAAGQYDYDNSTKSTQIPAYDVEFIGVGGRVVITANQYADAGAWVANGTAYEATFPNDIGKAFDFGVLDANGDAFPLEAQASIAAVQSDGGYYWDGTKVYVRLNDDRVPDSNLELYRGQIAGGEFAGIYMRGSNYSVYLEDIELRGWRADIRTRDISGVSTGLNLYLNNSKASKCILPYGDELFMFDSTFVGYEPTEDVVNYDGNAGGAPQYIIEHNCTFRMTNPSWGAGSGSSQCSTTHNNCKALRINSTYANAYGQNIADVSGSDYVCIDCDSTGSVSPSQVGYFIGTGSGGNAWLYNCTSTGDTVAIQVGDAASVAYYYNFTTDGSLDAGAGTITEIFNSGDTANTSVKKVLAGDSLIHVETAIGGGYKINYAADSQYITQTGSFNIIIVNSGGTITQYNDGVLVGSYSSASDWSALTIGTGASGGQAPVGIEKVLLIPTAKNATEVADLHNSL